MPISRTLNTYLDREHVHYDVLAHSEAFRAAEIAHTLQTSEKEMAKVVIVKVDKRFVMTVLPASWKVDLYRLRTVFATHHVRLATESEIIGLFPDCELGAMPPFGNLTGSLCMSIDRSRTMRRSSSKPEPTRMRSACATGTLPHSCFRWSRNSIVHLRMKAAHEDLPESWECRWNSSEKLNPLWIEPL